MYCAPCFLLSWMSWAECVSTSKTTPRDAPNPAGRSEKINTAIITEERDMGHVWHDKPQMDISGWPCVCLCVFVCVCGGHVCVYVCTPFCASWCVCLSGNMTCVPRLHGPLLCCVFCVGGDHDGERESMKQCIDTEKGIKEKDERRTDSGGKKAEAGQTDWNRTGTETEDNEEETESTERNLWMWFGDA